MTKNNSALIVIDVQKGIDESVHWGGNRNNPQTEENIEVLVKHWRRQHLPIFIIQHCSTSPDSPFRPGQIGNELKSIVTPRTGETTIQKSTANAFVATGLQKELDDLRITDVVVVGFVTNNSVEATARMAGDLGFKTVVVSDATACFDKVGTKGEKFSSALVHQLSLANLNGEYATIMTTSEVLNLQSSNLKSSI
jgi:nicotinamidase-related amidase